MNHNNKLPLVVIFGRTNVGKSTLFNRLVEKHQALTSKIEATTRDSNIGQIKWRGINFSLIDTGGIIDPDYLINRKKAAADLEARTQFQAFNYLKLADLILFLVDAKSGLLPQDKQLALIIKKVLSQKPAAINQGQAAAKSQPGAARVMLIANKTDHLSQRNKISEFHQLGLGEPVPVSAASGSGSGDLLDLIAKDIKSREIKPGSAVKQQSAAPGTARPATDNINICIIGKPNVGKSSLVNSILGYERVLVDQAPHTTREPQNTAIVYKNNIIVLVDTAGISKKGSKGETIEKFSISKTLGALNQADIALLILDINQPITRQDAKLIEEITGRKKSLVIVANKWDLIQVKDTKQYNQYIYAHLPFAAWAPVIFTSALSGGGLKAGPLKNQTENLPADLSRQIKKILDLILEINQNRHFKINDDRLNDFLKRSLKLHPPAVTRGLKRPRLKQLRQFAVAPPKFELQLGSKDNLRPAYLRYLENRLRQDFAFRGTPLTIKIVKQ